MQCVLSIIQFSEAALLSVYVLYHLLKFSQIVLLCQFQTRGISQNKVGGLKHKRASFLIFFSANIEKYNFQFIVLYFTTTGRITTNVP